jgi:hypothetical protein
MHTFRENLTGIFSWPTLNLIIIAVSIRRAGMAGKVGRLQMQTWFQRHEEFLKNKSNVQSYHMACIEHFFLAGKAKAEVAAPVTLALLLQSPNRPANIMKPFRCFLFNAPICFRALITLASGW